MTEEIFYIIPVYNIIIAISGIILGPLSRRFGCRAVGLVGSVFNLTGFALCFFAPNIPFLFFSYGFLTGIAHVEKLDLSSC